MGQVSKTLKGLFGGGGSSDAADAAYAAQIKSIRKQDDALAKKESDLAAVEAGQRRNRNSGRGLLAYIDDELKKSLG